MRALLVCLLLLILKGIAMSETVQNRRLLLSATVQNNQVVISLKDRAVGPSWANGPYLYSLTGTTEDGQKQTVYAGLRNPAINAQRNGVVITGTLNGTAIRITHRLTLSQRAPMMEERITLENGGAQPLDVADLAFGLRQRLTGEILSRRWVAVPYRRQSDGRLHDYSANDLLTGRFGNSDWRNDPSVADQEVSDAGRLRSEAWAWTDGRHGLLIAKYNPEMIEYSLADVDKSQGSASLRYGGVGMALYREPRPAARLLPGKSLTFGLTRYSAFDGDWPQGYALYRAFLEEKGHRLPADYHPPLNWNELFDVGWYHSNREQLFRYYTREALFREAEKAKEVGCDLLYLDPGWEVCEGTTLWDEERLGKVADFSRELKERYGLKLGYRTIGRVYRDEFPNAWYLRRKGLTGPYQMPRINAQPEPEPVPLALPDGRRNLALLPEAHAGASSVIPGYPDLHTIAHLNDGWYNNGASWVSAADPSWAEIDLGAAYTINEIALGSEHRVQFDDRAVSRFDVLVATEYNPNSDAATWQRVFQYDGAPIKATRRFTFPSVSARWVRVIIRAAGPTTARLDELEVYEAQPGTEGGQPARRDSPHAAQGSPIGFWEVCTQSKAWQQEKLRRILAVTGGGVDFMMFDEYDWRGPCYDPSHGHPVPSTPEGHVRAIYGLIEGMQAKYPQVLVEAHDPVWPWTMRYTPTYYRQGFAGNRYQENWGFEFMWNPIEDLKSGRALILYYYNLGTPIPLYDHITMEGDNDACLAFWWYASTVRHLGIGGKKGLNSAQENETRYAAYRKAVSEYNRLRDFYARGRFVGLDETAHLHLHPTERALVLNVYNLTDQPVHREVRLRPAAYRLGTAQGVTVEGAAYRRNGDALILSFDLPPLSPAHAVLRAR